MQAPIIMMSQNRQESRDRLRSENDYRVNLKAELEIRHLHEKLDHLLQHQWERLIEIQQIQIELMNELTAGRRRDREPGRCLRPAAAGRGPGPGRPIAHRSRCVGEPDRFRST